MDLEKRSDGTTEYGRKSTKEKKASESWLKSVGAFANGAGGVLVFGAAPDGSVAGIKDIETACGMIRQKIQECILPFPDVVFREKVSEDGKKALQLEVAPGQETPYYYASEGSMEVYVRSGKESIPASTQELKRLVLGRRQIPFDTQITEYLYRDFSFASFEDSYEEWTGEKMDERKYEEFGMVKRGRLTNAGLLFADHSPCGHSRIACTRWGGTDKSGGRESILDHAEYTGSLIVLINKSTGFIRRNTRILWKETGSLRTELPDYSDKSVFEGIVNALAHRDYSMGSAWIHIDIFDDRLLIESPGGMPDGGDISRRSPDMVPSMGRNPVLMGLFEKIGYMEQTGSGLSRMKKAYEEAVNYMPELAPEFYSDRGQFTAVLKNLNYKEEEKADNGEKNDEGNGEKSGGRDSEKNGGRNGGSGDGKNGGRNGSKSGGKNNGEKSKADGGKTGGIIWTGNERKVLELIAGNPSISTDEISRQGNIAKRTVERTIQSLKKKGAVTREGSRRSGYWTVNSSCDILG